MKTLALLIFVSLLPLLSNAQMPGVIHDPDGYTNLRAKASAQSDIVSKVKEGELFEFDVIDHTKAQHEWLKVKLANGKTGFMHSSRVRHYVTAKQLQDADPRQEIISYAKSKGIDYYATAREAVKGDAWALQKFFSLKDVDGAAAETHYVVIGYVVHLLGDTKMAAFVGDQKQGLKETIREALLTDHPFYPFKPEDYLKRCFPQTAAILKVGKP